jgi:hypothetical protein
VLRALNLAGKPRTEAHERAAAALAELALPLTLGHLRVTCLGARRKTRDRATPSARRRAPQPRPPPGGTHRRADGARKAATRRADPAAQAASLAH